MPDVQISVSVPQSTETVAAALVTGFVGAVAAAKAGGGVAAEAAAIGAALIPAIAAFSGIAADAKAEPIGVAEAFAIAGFQIERALKGN